MKKSVLALIVFMLWAGHASMAQNITVYRDANWSGPSMTIYSDWDAGSNPDWNDQISSIRIPAGARIQVFVDGQFQGDSRILDSDWTVTSSDFNDVISSIRFLHHHNRQITEAPASANRLCCGQELPIGGELRAPSGRYFLAFQGDRNLVIYKRVNGNRALWATATNNRVNRCVMQGDGNLVLYNDATPIWSSNTYGNPNAGLVMQDDGNLVIYATDGRPIWASNTNQPEEAAPVPVTVVVETPAPVPVPAPAVVDVTPCAMPQESYDAAVRAVDAQAFKESKMQMAKQAIRNKCLSLDQIRGIAKLFSFEDQTLDFLKYAYDFTNSKGDYYTLGDVFSFDANVRNFTDFLGTK